MTINVLLAPRSRLVANQEQIERHSSYLRIMLIMGLKLSGT